MPILYFIFTFIICSFLSGQLFMFFLFLHYTFQSLLKSMCATPEFCKGTFRSSVVHMYNIILQFMILLTLSVKAQFTHARGFCIPFFWKLVCNFFFRTILRLL